MSSSLRDLPIDQRIQLVEDLWDSIAADQSVLPVTGPQVAELDRRLEAYTLDRDQGRTAEEAIASVRSKL